MPTVATLCNLTGCVIDGIEQQQGALFIFAHTEDMAAHCPSCGQPSTRIHSYYTRTPKDLPITDYADRVVLRVRRYRCLNVACPKGTFAERLLAFLPVSAQRTTRLTTILYQIGQALGGEAGVPLLSALHLSTSPDTVLRILRRQREPARATPRILGVDDWALRKGRTYGTLLVDLERRQPVDLLPDRQASTLTAWLIQG